MKGVERASSQRKGASYYLTTIVRGADVQSYSSNNRSGSEMTRRFWNGTQAEFGGGT